MKNHGKNAGILKLSFKVEKSLLNNPNFSDTQATKTQLSTPRDSKSGLKCPDKSSHKTNKTTDANKIRRNILDVVLC